MDKLVSIIMPVYNAEKYVGQAIESVLAQSYNKWELIIINDGSKDESDKIIKSYIDDRISYFTKENGGVSSARNLGLEFVKGYYLCFLDSDDILPPNSLESRIQVFLDEPDVSFVDGNVVELSEDLAEVLYKWLPSFKGFPQEELIKLTGSCFYGISWMIRTECIYGIKFDQLLVHAEDLWFYIQISQQGGKYCYSYDTTYIRRITPGSAMSNLDGLKKGYIELNARLQTMNIPREWINKYRRKARSILFKSYLAKGRLIKALPFLFQL